MVEDKSAPSRATTTGSTSNLVGIGFMVGGVFMLSIMDAIAKWLVEENISPIQVLAVRSWIIISILILILFVRHEVSLLKTRRPLAHAFRGVFGFLSPFCFFLALKSLPLADATVVFFSSTFMLTAMSALIFKERVGIYRWGAVVTGFAGVLVAVNPQGDGEPFAYLLVLFSAFVYAILLLSGKRLAEQDSIISLVFSFNLMLGVISTLLLPLIWIPVSWSIVGIILLLSLFAIGGHYAATTAFSKAQVSAVAPFEYTALIWAALLGYLVWLDMPSLQVWIGAMIIVVSGLYVIYRESLPLSINQ